MPLLTKKYSQNLVELFYLVGMLRTLSPGVLGASVRNSTHGKGHEEGDLGIRKGGIEPQETPCSWASTSKTRVPTLLFYALTYTYDFTGGWPPTTSLGEGVNLQLQLIKIPGHDKSVSTYKLLWSFSSLPEQVRLVTCDYSLPTVRGTRCFKLSKYRFFWEVRKLLV